MSAPSPLGQAPRAEPPEPPPAALDAIEGPILSQFKSAALHVTQLYKEALEQSRRAFHVGYHQCLADTWDALAHIHAAQRQRLASQVAAGPGHATSLELDAIDALFFEFAHSLRQRREELLRAHPDAAAAEKADAAPLADSSAGPSAAPSRHSSVDALPHPLAVGEALESGVRAEDPAGTSGELAEQFAYKHRQLKRRLSDRDGPDAYAHSVSGAYPPNGGSSGV